MQALIAPLNELAEFEELYKNRTKESGMIRVCGCVNSQKTPAFVGREWGLSHGMVIMPFGETVIVFSVGKKRFHPLHFKVHLNALGQRKDHVV